MQKFRTAACAAAIVSLGIAGIPAISIAQDSAPKPAATSSPTPEKTATASPSAASVQWDTCDEPTHHAKEAGIPNFGKLNAHVWRSGQPSKEGFARLAEMGVKTIVNLREEYPQEKDMVPAGVKYVYIPVKDEHAPSIDQAKQFMQVVSDPQNWPVLVHCHGGEGRAGVMSAIVRHSFDGWDDARIMKEVSNYRSAPLGFIKIKMPGEQRKFISDWEAGNPAGALKQACTASAK